MIRSWNVILSSILTVSTNICCIGCVNCPLFTTDICVVPYLYKWPAVGHCFVDFHYYNSMKYCWRIFFYIFYLLLVYCMNITVFATNKKKQKRLASEYSFVSHWSFWQQNCEDFLLLYSSIMELGNLLVVVYSVISEVNPHKSIHCPWSSLCRTDEIGTFMLLNFTFIFQLILLFSLHWHC
jgi:hypothetical protein